MLRESGLSCKYSFMMWFLYNDQSGYLGFSLPPPSSVSATITRLGQVSVWRGCLNSAACLVIPYVVVGLMFIWFLNQHHTTLWAWSFPFCEHGDLRCSEPFLETVRVRKQKPLFFSCSVGFLLVMFFNSLFYSFCFGLVFYFLKDNLNKLSHL